MVRNLITDSIKYIGVNDKKIDLFESQYRVQNGISYNSYVILDDKIAIMDTIDVKVTDEWLENLENTLEDRKPDYLIISHMEPDHAANIAKLAELYPNMQIVGNAKTFNMLPRFFNIENLDDRKVVVNEGSELNLGNHTLVFYMAPMVHWPEVMVTYEKSEKILFSADAFGKFGALDIDEPWEDEAARYYFNIVGKYGVQVQALLKKASNLEIDFICPLHGPVLSENISYYIDKYNKWSSYEPEEEGVLIAYASIHGNTKKAALEMAEILKLKGAKNVITRDLSREDSSEVILKAFQYNKLILASSTYDAGIFPPMEEFLQHLKSKNFQKRTIGLIENGSWGPMAAKLMRGIVETFKDINICDTTITIKSTMKEEDKEVMNELAEAILD